MGDSRLNPKQEPQEPHTLGEFADASAIKEDVIARAQHGARRRRAEEEDRVRAERLRAETQNRQRLRKWLAFTVLGGLAASAFFVFAYRRFFEPIRQPQPGQFPDVMVVSRVVDRAWILTKTMVKVDEHARIPVTIYDFDANRFLKGKRQLDSPQLFQDAIQGAAADLRDAWLLVFAGASVEGFRKTT